MNKTLRWILLLLYIFFIYAMLGIAPAIWERVNSFLGGRGEVVIMLLAASGLIMVLSVSFAGRTLDLVRLSAVMVCAPVYVLLYRWAEYAAEKIHLIEYGILPILVISALDPDKDRSPAFSAVISFLICALAGTLDEIIQFYLPNRVFDWRDIGINVLSSLLGIVLVMAFRHKKDISPQTSDLS